MEESYESEAAILQSFIQLQELIYHLYINKTSDIKKRYLKNSLKLAQDLYRYS